MSTNETQNPKNTARDTVIQGNNIQDNIRHIVVQALKDGKMESEANAAYLKVCCLFST